MQRKWTKWQWAEMLLFAGPVTFVCAIAGIGMALWILQMVIFGFPGHSRENARRASCQSNLKQIALALKQYSQDYDNFPPAINSTSGTGDRGNWAGKLSPYSEYARTGKIFQCPSDDKANNSQTSSYGYNARLSAAKSKVKNAASVILNFEVQADSNNQTQSGISPTSVSANKRHLDGANYSFADGHVKWLRPERLTNGAADGKNYTFRLNEFTG